LLAEVTAEVPVEVAVWVSDGDMVSGYRTGRELQLLARIRSRMI